jgi:hypothetical protein
MATNSSVYYPPPVAELRHQRFGQDQLRAGVIRLPEIFPPLHVAKVTSPWTCPNTFDHLGQAPVARARGHDYARSVLVRPNGPRRQPKSPNRETSHRRYGGDFGSFGTAISFVLVRRKRRFGTAPT